MNASSRLPLSDRRARTRAAPDLHGHDRRRARAPGQHAGVGRPQRRRDRRQRSPSTPSGTVRRPVPQGLRDRQGHPRRRPPARLGRRAGRPLQGDLLRGLQDGRLRRLLLRGPARRRRATQPHQPAAEVVPRHLPRLHRPRPRRDARRHRRSPRGSQEASAAAPPTASTSPCWPPPSARSAACSTTTRRRSSSPSTTTRSRRWA